MFSMRSVNVSNRQQSPESSIPYLDMEGVSGSIPLPPTIGIRMLAQWALCFAHETLHLATRPRRFSPTKAELVIDIR